MYLVVIVKIDNKAIGVIVMHEMHMRKVERKTIGLQMTVTAKLHIKEQAYERANGMAEMLMVPHLALDFFDNYKKPRQRKEHTRTRVAPQWNKGRTKESDPRVAAHHQKITESRIFNGTYVAWNKGLKGGGKRIKEEEEA